MFITRINSTSGIRQPTCTRTARTRTQDGGLPSRSSAGWESSMERGKKRSTLPEPGSGMPPSFPERKSSPLERPRRATAYTMRQASVTCPLAAPCQASGTLKKRGAKKPACLPYVCCTLCCVLCGVLYVIHVCFRRGVLILLFFCLTFCLPFPPQLRARARPSCLRRASRGLSELQPRRGNFEAGGRINDLRRLFVHVLSFHLGNNQSRDDPTLCRKVEGVLPIRLDPFGELG